MPEKKLVRVLRDSTGEVVKEFDVTDKSDRQVQRVVQGLNRQLNHDDYTVVEDTIPDVSPG